MFLYSCTYRMLCPLSDRPFLSKQQTQQFFLCHLVLEHFHKFFFADIIVTQCLEFWQVKMIEKSNSFFIIVISCGALNINLYI